jgi:agmatinase
MQHTGGGDEPLGPIDPLVVPRFAGPATYARLPRLDQVERCDVAVVGVPFDGGTTYRPGARFGPAAIRAGSRLMRGYHPGLDLHPFAAQQVADAGDIACTPFDIAEAIVQIEGGARALLDDARHIVALGGDHTIALPLLRAVHAGHGPLALIHFDAHLDTWDTYFGAAYTHGTPFRRAHEEGLLASDRCAHVGIRGPLFSAQDLVDDAGLGFTIVGAFDYLDRSVDSIAEELRARVGDLPVYVSIDVDVMDPAHAPGTGTPEAGGITSRELLATLRALAGLHLVAADVVEVAPAYDQAEVTSIAAANVVYELLGLFATTS